MGGSDHLNRKKQLFISRFVKKFTEFNLSAKTFGLIERKK